MHNELYNKQFQAYLVLTACVICGLAASTITASKVTHVVIDFPFSNIIFSVFTYPFVDCICELWGRRAALRTMWIGLLSQMMIMLLIQLSISAPHAAFWNLQNEYATVLSVTGKVMFASLLAFAASQILDVMIYQRIKNWSQGKWLWLRSNISIYLGQIVDSAIFISIIFYDSEHKLQIFSGSVLVKILLAILMTPVIYLIIYLVNSYLDHDTLAFVPEPA